MKKLNSNLGSIGLLRIRLYEHLWDTPLESISYRIHGTVLNLHLLNPIRRSIDQISRIHDENN